MTPHTNAPSTTERFANRAAFNRYRDAAQERYQRLMAAKDRPVISIPYSECTRAKGVDRVIATLEQEIAARGLDVDVRRVGCFGNCYAEPIIEVRKDGWPAVMYGYVTPEDVAPIL